MPSLNVVRPKLATTNTLSQTFEVQTVTSSGNSFFLPVTIDGLSIPDFNIASCSWTTSSDQITASSGSFTNVRLGDVVQGSGGAGVDFASGTYVTAKTLTALTVSTNGLTTGSNQTLTIKPGTMDATVCIVEVETTTSGSQLNIKTKVHKMNGLKVQDADNDNYDDATVSDASESVTHPDVKLEMDTFLVNARVPRTNS